MDVRSLRKLLAKLEVAYPDKVDVSLLMKEFGLRSYSELNKVVEYLNETGRVIVDTSESGVLSTMKRDWLTEQDKLKATSKGIDYLYESREQKIEKNRTAEITKATLVLALAGFIQAIFYFEQFSQGVKNFYDWLALCIMGIAVVAISTIIWQPLLHLLGLKNPLALNTQNP